MPIKNVTTAGARVQLTTTRGNANEVVLLRKPANAGKIYIGLAGDSRNTGASVSSSAYDFYVDASTILAVIIGGGGDSKNPIDPSTIWLDADTNGEGVIWYARGV